MLAPGRIWPLDKQEELDIDNEQNIQSNSEMMRPTTPSTLESANDLVLIMCFYILREHNILQIITTFSETDNTMQNIPPFNLNVEYSTDYCQSRRTLVWIWMMFMKRVQRKKKHLSMTRLPWGVLWLLCMIRVIWYMLEPYSNAMLIISHRRPLGICLHFSKKEKENKNLIGCGWSVVPKIYRFCFVLFVMKHDYS